MSFTVPESNDPDVARIEAESAAIRQQDPKDFADEVESDSATDSGAQVTPYQSGSSSSPATGSVPAIERSRHLATQVEYPWRTSIRTAVGTFLLFLAAAAAASPIIGPFVDRYVPGAGAGVLAFGVFCGALALLIKRIGTLPAVAALLVRLGIGVVPKSALKS